MELNIGTGHHRLHEPPPENRANVTQPMIARAVAYGEAHPLAPPGTPEQQSRQSGVNRPASDCI